MKENIQRLRKELKDPLECLYGQRLKGVFLFGSYARGEADAESDIDVLIVLDHITRMKSSGPER
jgi:predicted nucleotidyltransferase